MDIKFLDGLELVAFDAHQIGALGQSVDIKNHFAVGRAVFSESLHRAAINSNDGHIHLPANTADGNGGTAGCRVGIDFHLHIFHPLDAFVLLAGQGGEGHGTELAGAVVGTERADLGSVGRGGIKIRDDGMRCAGNGN